MVFVTEQMVSKPEKNFSPPKTMVDTTKKMVLEASTMAFASGTLDWETRNMVSKPETIFWVTGKMVSMVKWRIKALPIRLSISGHFNGDQLTRAHGPTLIHTDTAADGDPCDLSLVMVCRVGMFP